MTDGGDNSKGNVPEFILKFNLDQGLKNHAILVFKNPKSTDGERAAVSRSILDAQDEFQRRKVEEDVQQKVASIEQWLLRHFSSVGQG